MDANMAREMLDGFLERDLEDVFEMIKECINNREDSIEINKDDRPISRLEREFLTNKKYYVNYNEFSKIITITW